MLVQLRAKDEALALEVTNNISNDTLTANGTEQCGQDLVADLDEVGLSVSSVDPAYAHIYGLELILKANGGIAPMRKRTQAAPQNVKRVA